MNEHDQALLVVRVMFAGEWPVGINDHQADQFARELLQCAEAQAYKDFQLRVVSVGTLVVKALRLASNRLYDPPVTPPAPELPNETLDRAW